jgi:hypothetical protein
MAFQFGNRPVTQPELGWAKRKGVVRFGALVTITAAGAIASQDKSEFTGMNQAVKTGGQVGRYTFQLPALFRNLRGADVTILGPDSANYGANTTGLGWFWRRNDIDTGNINGTSNKDGTIELQFIQSSYADAEVPSGVSFIVEIEAETWAMAECPAPLRSR